MERKALQLEVKAISETGTFEGYASVFNVLDLGNDIVLPGSFVKSIEANPNPPILWNHNDDVIIGVFRDLKEDEKGLFVKGELNLETQAGKEAYALLKQGALKGLSIGYLIDDFEMKNGVRLLKQLSLMEISTVGFPMNTSAQVTSVKSQDDFVLRLERLEKQIAEFTASNELATNANSQPQPQSTKGLTDDVALKISETFRELKQKWN